MCVKNKIDQEMEVFMSVTFRHDVERAIQNMQFADIEGLIPNDANQDLLGLTIIDIINAGQSAVATRLLSRVDQPWILAEAFMAAAGQGFYGLMARAAQAATANGQPLAPRIIEAARERARQNGHQIR